jgi:hypothetical protein
MTEDRVFSIIRLRVRAEELEQDLSCALHLLYGLLALIPRSSPIDGSQIAGIMRFKILQLPQGCRVGRRLIELDEQRGGLLEGKGIWLKRWVYESRERGNE